ncbi:MAG TPA: hypothetical protein PLM73_09675 [Petrotogaceae bacterium]|jgi:hypothetical protein|nr:hypothetical protein [Petrotogaceae bacterium]HOT32100.1 hypothetical protein [Petrotogaceae bacterium]HPA92448.1 hypothetical protein [Petrotogaceae bacterium]HPX16060.1 hypothetical protein [Petrotogaceae bacterium]HQF33958.1 hypothetical protein [Petrotogaceae bacterium]
MLRIVYLVILVYFLIVLIVSMKKSREKRYEWIMGVMIAVPWILKVLGVR